MKSPTPTYRSETKSPAPTLPDDRQIMSPTERMKQITIESDSDSDSSFSQSVPLSGRENLQKTPDEQATSALITSKPTLSTRSSTKSPSMPPSLSKTGQRLSKESAKSTDFSENTEPSQSRGSRSVSKAVSAANASPRSMGSKKVASVRITSPSESRASQKTIQESPRRSGSKSPSVLKSSTRSSKSSGTKSPKPKPMTAIKDLLIPSDTDSEWSNLGDISNGKAKLSAHRPQTSKGNNTFTSVMNELDDDDSFNFE